MAKRLYVWTTQHSKKRKIQTPILMTPFGATRTDPSHIPFTYWTIWLRCCCALVVVVVAVVSLRVYVFCFDLILCYCMGGWLFVHSVQAVVLCMWWISTCLLQLVPPALSRIHLSLCCFCWCWIFLSVKFTVWMTNIQRISNSAAEFWYEIKE